MRVFDLHCDTIGECYKQRKSLLKNNLHIDLNRLSKYELYTQVFAIWIPDELRGKEAFDYFNNVADLFYEELNNNSSLVSLFSDNRDTPVKAMLSVEGASGCGGTIEGLYELYKRGVRIVTLTWNGRNEIGGGALSEGGLTPFGKDFVKECEKIGVVVDVSHLNKESFWEVADIYSGKMIATHSNADIIDNPYAHSRNLSLDQMEEIKKRDGLIGLNFYNKFIEVEHIKGIDSVKYQIDFFLKHGFENVVSLGSDYDGCSINDELCGADKMSSIYGALTESGYNKNFLDNLFYNNADAYFKKIF